MYISVVPYLSTTLITDNHHNFPVCPMFGTKLDMLFEIAKPVEIVIILGEGGGQLFFSKTLDFMEKTPFCCCLCPHKFTKKSNFFFTLNKAIMVF